MDTDDGQRDGGPITVLIVDDHRVLTESLAHALDEVDGITVLDAAADLATALSVVAARRPHVVLMDASLPDGDGAAAAPEVQQCSPGTAVIVISGMDHPSTIGRAVRAGAAGFLSKSQPLVEMVAAIRDVAAGGSAFTRDQLRCAAGSAPTGDDELSEREREVLQLLADGVSTRDIADQLVVSIHTVRNHVRHLTEKLGASSRIEAVAIGHRRGLVDPPRT